jgi:hypothetical protein
LFFIRLYRWFPSVRDAGLSDLEAELEQLAMDARR